MGGKSFPNTKPVDAEIIPYFRYTVEELTKAALGRVPSWERVGSARWKRTGEVGDVDVALLLDDADWAIFCANVNDLGFQNRKITKRCMAVEVPTPDPFAADRTTTYQLDFNQSKHLEFSAEMFWSAERSSYKGAHRNILLQAILNVLKTNTLDLTKYELRTKEFIDLYEGLVYLVQTSRGTSRFQTVDRRVLKPSEDYTLTEIVQTFLPEAYWYDLNNFESLYLFLMKKYYVKDTANDMMQMIMREAGFMIQSAKLEMPHEIKCWVEFD